MSKYIELMDKIYAKGGGYEKMAEATSILDTMFAELCKAHPELYKSTMHEFEALAYQIDRPEAETIVKAMKPYGQKWSHDQIKDFVSDKGISEHICNWYLVMNAMYNDYRKTAELVGKSDDAEFYFALAKDFINDVDAKPFKVEKYFLTA